MNDSADVKDVSTMTIVHPAAEEHRLALSLAPRLTSLRGTKIGIIHNTKHMAGEFLTELERLLKEKYDVKEFEFYRKAHASVPIPSEVLQRFVASCDAVVHGVAD